MNKRIALIKDLPPPSVEDAHLHALLRKTRALRALSASIGAVVHATTETGLQCAMCRAIVDVGGYRTAWIGWAEHDEKRSVRPVECAGEGAGYVRHADVSWGDGERGGGPTGRCIRSGEPQIVSDLQSDPAMGPWRKHALEVGYRSSAALPLNVDGEIGALNIYAAEPDAFDHEELALLVEMAAELCFGLANLRRQRAQAERTARLVWRLDHVAKALMEGRGVTFDAAAVDALMGVIRERA